MKVDNLYIVSLLNEPLSDNKNIKHFEEEVYIKSRLYRTLPTLYEKYLKPI